MRRELFESVWLGSQAFYQATAFNQNIGAWNTAAMTTMASVCALRHRQCVRSVCFMHSFVLDSFLEEHMCTTDITEALFGLRPPQPPQSVAPHLDGRGPAHRSARTWPTGRCVHSAVIGPSGLGLMRRVLFESVWLGSQAFFFASAFNAGIGAWNTASVTTMSSVCALCTSLRTL
jgi:surface protein